MEMALCRVHNVRFYDVEPRAIHCMKYEKNLQKLALSRSDGSIEVWNLSQTPHIERTFPGRVECSVEAIAWCKRRLFSAGLRGTVSEHDLKTLSCKYDIPVTAGPCWCLSANRANTRLAAGTEDGFVNIFTVTNEGLTFEKVLYRQEGRILCLDWDATGDMVVTGSADAVRIWNVHTGHAIHRMTPGRLDAKKETIVWCLTVTTDFTIISGDSRGHICFWDGNVGTQTETFRTHKADILSICLEEDENSVYFAGIDPLIASYAKIKIRGNGSGAESRVKWVKSVQRRVHDHDVRALAVANGKLFSGGVDSYLALSSFPPRVLLKYPPILQGQCVAVCSDARYIMLRYTTHLEVWKLGSTASSVDDTVTVSRDVALPLMQQPVHLLTLKSRGGDSIVCANMSSNGKWIAYSTFETTRFFKFHRNKNGELQKAPLLQELALTTNIVFTPDSTGVIISTNTGSLYFFSLENDEIVLQHSFSPLDEKLLKDAIHLLTVSPDSKYVIAADLQNNIAVWTKKNWKHYCSLPRYHCAPTALAVQPGTNFLVVVYCDHKIVEFSLKDRKYTKFSRGLHNKHPTQWLSRGFVANSITFDPSNEDVIVLQDDSTICVINKGKELPSVEAKIPRLDSSRSPSMSDSMDSNIGNPGTTAPQHAFHVIRKYKHLVHFQWLSGDEFIAVEVSAASLMDKLPPTLKQKRYGM